MLLTDFGSADLVNLIYEAALDSSKWQDFLVAFCLSLRSHTGMIWANHFNSGSIDPALAGQDVFTQVGFSPEMLASFAAYYAQRNVWMEDPRLHHGGSVVHDGMLFPDSRLKRTEFWGDWLRPQDIFYSSAAIVEKRHDRSVNVTVCRPQSVGPYDESELAMLAALMPHLQAGFALHRRLYRLEALAHASTSALEAVPFGIVLLDHLGHALHVNLRAERMAEASRLLKVHDHARLHCTAVADDATLQRLVGEATRTGVAEQGGAGGAMHLHGLDGTRLQLLVLPLPSWSTPFGQRTAAAVFITDPAAALGSLSTALRGVYGMTPAEARLTESLANGRSPQEYADQQSISMNTVRTQIKAAAAKAGVSRQSDLVRVVLTGPAVLGQR
jgi:DNA-binding CsgD family transcriptional regulator